MKFTFLICCTFSLEKYHIELNYLNQQLRIQNQLQFCPPIGIMYTYGPRSNPIQCLLVPNPLENVTWISINHPGGIGWYLQSIGLYKKVCDPSEALGPQSTLCYAKHMQVQHTVLLMKVLKVNFFLKKLTVMIYCTLIWKINVFLSQSHHIDVTCELLKLASNKSQLQFYPQINAMYGPINRIQCLLVPYPIPIEKRHLDQH